MKVDPTSPYQFNAEKLEPDNQERVEVRLRDETGAYTNGVAWNDLTAESSSQYADNIKYLNLVSTEEFSTTISNKRPASLMAEEEQQLLSDTATILKMDPPWDVTEDALHAAERALFAITKAVHHYKWHRQVLGDFWMARAVLVLKPYDAA